MRIAIIAYAFYDGNSRILQYANALARRGDTVDAFVLRRESQPEFEIVNGVNVHRIQGRILGRESQVSYALQVGLYMLLAAWRVSKNHMAEPYQVIHVHSVPDFLVFAAAIPKLSGASIILDIHDILPEFYSSKFGGGQQGILFKFLVAIERISISFSDHVIIANHIWYDRLISRSVKPEKLSTFNNYPDLDVFVPRSRTRSDGKFVITYPGSLNWHQGVDIAVRAFALASREIPNAEFHIYGEGPEKANLIRLAKELSLGDKVLFSDFIPIREISEVMANSDLAVVPKRAKSGFGNEAASTKIMEFMAVGVPIIAARTKIDTYYHDDSRIKFFESENVEDLARAILDLYGNPELRQELSKNALAYVKENSWARKKQEYLALVDSLALPRWQRETPKPIGAGNPQQAVDKPSAGDDPLGAISSERAKQLVGSMQKSN